jgi:SPOR domain
LQQKYSGALARRRLSYHRMKENGAFVYKVRVASLSQADAQALCAKLQAAGGGCEVAPQ